VNTLLPLWNALLVHPLMRGLEFVATQPLLSGMPTGVAGALAIIIFTVFLRLVLVPLSLVQIRSQRAQMSIQPELKAIQRKFKGDREGLARAQMALYKERGINPAAGCLPLVIQMPILIGMYAAMSQLATGGLTLDQVTLNRCHTTSSPLPRCRCCRTATIPSRSMSIRRSHRSHSMAKTSWLRHRG
jgi:YidC/Oxa1 family membrane protein insertase